MAQTEECILMPTPFSLELLVLVRGYGDTLFWERESTINSTTLVIPVIDGVPRVADFIHVPTKDIVYPAPVATRYQQRSTSSHDSES